MLFAKDKQKQREQLRINRSIHPYWYRHRSACKAAQHLKLSGLLKRYHHIASYIDITDEFPTDKINQTIVAAGREVSFPVITNYPEAAMRFLPWNNRTKFTRNRYGIPEPIGTITDSELIRPDLVLLPLLGFDKQGNRLGMGGGYYDRYLGNMVANKRPLLIGLAFDNQRVESIKHEAFDIPLHGILTESQLKYFYT